LAVIFMLPSSVVPEIRILDNRYYI
jgi:hypothetical protein